jgi:hypothetical protein
MAETVTGRITGGPTALARVQEEELVLFGVTVVNGPAALRTWTDAFTVWAGTPAAEAPTLKADWRGRVAAWVVASVRMLVWVAFAAVTITGFGANAGVTPEGTLAAERLTFPEKLFWPVICAE